jgi:tRNA pseudouridine13 synthase
MKQAFSENICMDITEPLLHAQREYEPFVGISEYSTSTTGIGGKIKADFADFIVREITPNRDTLSTREKNPNSVPFNRSKDRYTTFTLIKKNMDTIYAAKIIADYLHIYENEVTWAGIKDNTAITAQRFAVPGDQLDKLAKFSHKNITITSIYPARKGIEIGDLWGNHFEINIRNTTSSYDELKPVLQQWQDEILDRGFPNYYGLQRFGQHRPNSQRVGKLLFLKRYQEAYEEIMFRIYPEEFLPIQTFRRQLAALHPDQATTIEWPPSLHYERMIFDQIKQNPSNYLQALQALPKSLLNIIFSSYQSYLFNMAVSMRMKRGDPLNRPIDGDVIAVLDEPIGAPTLVFYRFGRFSDEAILKAFQQNRATIVAPVPGYKTDLERYPYFKAIYQEILKEEEFSLETFQNGLSGYFDYGGTFRPIFQRPTGLHIEQAHVLNNYGTLDPHGVKLEFSLPKGTYATMLLRELMKAPITEDSPQNEKLNNLF